MYNTLRAVKKEQFLKVYWCVFRLAVACTLLRSLTHS